MVKGNRIPFFNGMTKRMKDLDTVFQRYDEKSLEGEAGLFIMELDPVSSTG